MMNDQTRACKNRLACPETTRREFIKRLAIAGGAAALMGNMGIMALPCYGSDSKNRTVYSFIGVDYDKCTGCRTCEAVCASFNQSRHENGNRLQGPGNPYFANIKVHHYNPDVDVPSVCAMCPDTPCIDACPVSPDPKTGSKALFRDGKAGVVRNDTDRCIGCGACVDACQSKGAGVIIQHPETDTPLGMCTLCNGDPQCVRHCPYGALKLIKGTPRLKPDALSSDKISAVLIKKLYNL